MRKKYFLILLLLIFIVGCQQTEQTPEGGIAMPTESVSAEESDPYAGPEAEAYVAPEEPTMVPYVFRTSKAGTTTIHGLLFVADYEQGMPNKDVDDAIFLVPLPEGEGVTMIPSFKIGEVPQADVDERSGEFVFTDIDPGIYIIMVYTNGNAQIPARTQDGNFAIIKIQEEDRDQTIEVNHLLVP